MNETVTVWLRRANLFRWMGWDMAADWAMSRAKQIAEEQR